MTDQELENYKQKVKEEILRDCVPFYQQWIQSTAGSLRLPAFVIPLVFSAVPYLAGLLAAFVLNEDRDHYSKFWLQVNASGILAGIFFFLSYIYTKTITYLDAFLFVLTSREQVDRLHQSYRLMFKSHLQLVNCFFWGVVTAGTVFLLGIPLATVNLLYFEAVVFVIGFLLGAGVWYTVTLSMMIRKFCRFQDIRINPLDPSRTVGIRELAYLCSMWSICLVFEGALILLGLYCADWSGGEAVVYNATVFWTAYLSLITLYMFLYPHVEIKRIIETGKRRSAKLFQLQIERFTSRHGSHGLEELEKLQKEVFILSYYHTIFNSIIKSPSLAIDISVIGRFLSAMIVPLMITFLQHPEYFTNFYRSIVDAFR